MKYQTIIKKRYGALACFITNRPKYKNAQSRLMIEELDHAFAVAKVLSLTLDRNEQSHHFLLSTQPRHRTALLEFGMRFRWLPVVLCEWHA